MTGFPNHMRGMKPWFGTRYHFEPVPDITALELAQVLMLLSEQTGTTKISGWLELPAGIPAPLDRHFRALTYPGAGG